MTYVKEEETGIHVLSLERNLQSQETQMDELNDCLSSDGFKPLFIKEEEEGDQRNALTRGHHKECNMFTPVVPDTGTENKHLALTQPYLQEMDELLKSCEELPGTPFGAPLPASYSESSHGWSNCCEEKNEVQMESFPGALQPLNTYLSTSYIDTQMDEDDPVESRSQSRAITSQNTSGVSLSTVGNKLGQSMMEYEGQLRGMLAMLESCMEETGMDFEPQDWATDEGVEYVHISKNPQAYRGATLLPIGQEGKAQARQLETFAEQEEDEGQDRDHRDPLTVGPLAEANGLSSSSYWGDTSEDKLEWTEENLEQSDVFSQPLEPLGEIKELASNKAELETDRKMGFGKNELEALGTQMENFISEVEQLVTKRRELLAEVLQLRGSEGQEETKWTSKEEATESQIDSKVNELMDILRMEKEGRKEEREREIKILKQERAEEERQVWRVNLERQGLQDELRKLKRRLFTMVKDCAHCQTTLNNQRREVDLLNGEEEKLDTLLLQLTEESSHLRSSQQKQISDLQTQLQAQRSLRTPNTQKELSECRRHSCGDIEQLVEAGRRTLEERYEPILLALLKRRESTSGALVKAKEQIQELKSQVRPLREELQKLQLQKLCLEEKLRLVHIHREEDVGQFKETVFSLEESCRGLRTELQIQKMKNKEMETQRDNLTKQLLLYRGSLMDHEP